MRLMGWMLVLLAALLCACTDAHRPGGGSEGEGETDAGAEQDSGEATECCWPMVWLGTDENTGGQVLLLGTIRTDCPSALRSGQCEPIETARRCWRIGEVNAVPVTDHPESIPLPADCSRPAE